MYNPDKPITTKDEFSDLSEGDAYDKFEELYKDFAMNNKELADKWHKDLMHKVDEEEITIQEACRKIRGIFLKRLDVEVGISVDGKEISPEQEIIINEQRIQVNDLKNSLNIFNNFLGNGSVGEVYKVYNHSGACVKVVYDYERYQEGNDIHKEGVFLDKLSDFQVEGVRTPKLFHTVDGFNFKALVMEELDAVCFRRVLEGHDELPEAFEFDDYFSKLKKYLEALHEKGVYHQDFVLRNFMIDRKTGMPYVIDFGKSKFKDDMMGERSHDFLDIAEDKDFAGLESGRAEVYDFLAKKGLKN